MAQALPLTKIAGLLVKTLAKPLSKSIKHNFARNPYTSRILIGVGQASHQFTSRMTIWSAGYRVRSISRLDEEKALKEGAELVGEGFILSVSLGWLFFEYNRGKEKEMTRELKRRAATKAERDALRAKLKALDVRVKALEESALKSNEQSSSTRILSLGATNANTYLPPKDEDLVPIQDDDDEDDESDGQLGATIAETSDGVTASSLEDNQVKTKPLDRSIELGAAATKPATTTSWWKFW